MSNPSAFTNGVLDEEVAEWAAAHPNVPVDWVRSVLRGDVPLEQGYAIRNVFEAIAGNDGLPGEVIAEAWRACRDVGGLEETFASNPAASYEVLGEITEVAASGSWQDVGGLFYTLSRNRSLPDSCGRALVERAFVLLDHEPEEMHPSIVGFIERTFQDEHRAAVWFTSETTSKALVLAAIA